MSVVLPFYGDVEAADEALAALTSIRLAAGDQLIAVDNTPDARLVARAAGTGVRAIESPVKRAAYTARNVGADSATGDWLLFIDADCRPLPALLDEYFAEAVEDRAGAVAGEVVGAAGQTTLVARYARTRGHLGQAANLEHPYRPMAVTANLLVRRRAWDEVGGFAEGARGGGDAELCWRLQDAGWSLAYQPRAVVEHVHRDRLVPLLRQAARDGAGGAWIERRYAGSGRRPAIVRGLGRALGGVVAWTLAGRFQRAVFKAIDGLWILATNVGYLAGNATPVAENGADDDVKLIVYAAGYPDRAQRGLVEDLQARAAAGTAVRVVAASRPWRPDWSAARGLPVWFSEDVGIARRALDTCWALVRHPLGSARALLAGRHAPPLRAAAIAARQVSRAGPGELVAADRGRSLPGALAVAALLGRKTPRGL